MGIKMSRERRGRIKGKFDNNLEDPCIETEYEILKKKKEIRKQRRSGVIPRYFLFKIQFPQTQRLNRVPRVPRYIKSNRNLFNSPQEQSRIHQETTCEHCIASLRETRSTPRGPPLSPLRVLVSRRRGMKGWGGRVGEGQTTR